MKTENQTSKKNTLVIILILLLALSLSIHFSHFIYKGRIKKDNLVLSESKENALAELEKAKIDIYQYKGLNNELDQIIKKANEEIAQKEYAIRLLVSENKLKDEENKRLLLEIDSLREAYLGIIDSMLMEHHANEELNAKINELEQVVKQLDARLGYAEKLDLENLNAIPQKVGITGKMQKTVLAKKTSDIKICFDILPNKAAPKGLTKIYIRIISPSAVVLINDEKGSGTFTHPEYKKDFPYTTMDEITYEHKQMSACINWEHTENYIPGLYIAEIFTNKYKIGFTTFTLK